MTDDQTRRIRQLEDENMSLLENVKDYDKIISILLNEIGGKFEISDYDLKSSPYRFGVTMEAENGPLIFKSFKKTEERNGTIEH